MNKQINLLHAGTIGNAIFSVTLSEEMNLVVGDKVRLDIPDGNGGPQPIPMNFKVVDLWKGEIRKVPAALLEVHYDNICKTFSGMCMMHQLKYGPLKVRPTEMLQVVVLCMMGAGEEIVQVRGMGEVDKVLYPFRNGKPR